MSPLLLILAICGLTSSNFYAIVIYFIDLKDGQKLIRKVFDNFRRNLRNRLKDFGQK